MYTLPQRGYVTLRMCNRSWLSAVGIFQYMQHGSTWDRLKEKQMAGWRRAGLCGDSWERREQIRTHVRRHRLAEELD
jgi:hypothetical protein